MKERARPKHRRLRESLESGRIQELVSLLASLLGVIASVTSAVGTQKGFHLAQLRINPTYTVLTAIVLALIVLYVAGLGVYKFLRRREMSLESALRSVEHNLFKRVDERLRVLLQGGAPNGR